MIGMILAIRLKNEVNSILPHSFFKRGLKTYIWSENPFKKESDSKGGNPLTKNEGVNIWN